MIFKAALNLLRSQNREHLCFVTYSSSGDPIHLDIRRAFLAALHCLLLFFNATFVYQEMRDIHLHMFFLADNHLFKYLGATTRTPQIVSLKCAVVPPTYPKAIAHGTPKLWVSPISSCNNTFLRNVFRIVKIIIFVPIKKRIENRMKKYEIQG